MKDIPEIQFNEKDENKLIGFELLNLRELITDISIPIDHNPFKPHRLNFFAVIIITDGEVNHSIDFETHNLKQGDSIVISKGQIHAFDKNMQYEGFMIIFTEAFMQKFIAQSTIAQINHLYNYTIKQEKINCYNENESFIHTLKSELTENSSSLSNIIGALLGIYLVKINDLLNKKSTIKVENKNLEYFYQFKVLVEEKFTHYRDAKAYASELSISYKHLNEVCKEVIKNTAKSFIDGYVTLEAKRMLVSTSLSVKEIAYTLGFDESTNFLKYFKRHTQVTPLDYRKKIT